MSSTLEIDAGGNDRVGVEDMEGILPACSGAWDYLPWHIQIRRL